MQNKLMVLFAIILLLLLASSASAYSGSVVDVEKLVSARYQISGGSNYELIACPTSGSHRIKVTVRPGDTILFQITGSAETDISLLPMLADISNVLVGRSSMEIIMLGGSDRNITNESFSAGTSHTISREISIPDGLESLYSGGDHNTGIQVRVKTHWYRVSEIDGKITILGSRSVTVRIELIVGESPSPVTGVKITKRPPNFLLRVGETFQLQAQVTPVAATNQKILWDAELSKGIIDINPQTGLISGLKPGRVGVWAYSDENSDIRDAIYIDVIDLEAKFDPEELDLAPPYIGVNRAGTEEAYVSIELDLPPASKDSFVADWTSRNTELVNVESIDNGRKAKVTVNSLTPENYPGLNTAQGDSVEVTLDVSIEAGLHGSINTTFPVTVRYIPVSWIRIYTDKEGAGREYRVSYDPNPAKVDQLTMEATIYPEDATNPEVNWHLYDHSLGTIYEDSVQDTPLTYARFVLKPVLRGDYTTFIIVESASNPGVGDFIYLYVQNVHSGIPKDFKASPVGEVELTEEHKKLIDRVHRETYSTGDSYARRDWERLQWIDKALDYVPYKSLFNAIRELRELTGGNALKEFANALFGNISVQAVDHFLQHIFGDDYADDLFNYLSRRTPGESR